LKPVILRIAQMTVDIAAQYLPAGRVAWILERSGQMLRLSIDLAAETRISPLNSLQQSTPSATTLNPLEAIRARVALSGGNSDCVRNTAGRRTIVCNWED
jgi:hypothetical protein